MSAKEKRLSPAKARAAEALARSAAAPLPQEPKWPQWETKVDKISSREYSSIVAGWLANIPEIDPPGAAPRETISSISSINDTLLDVPTMGDLRVALSGARPGVLHEAYYLAHKAIHVQISCANLIQSGLHTWAIVDAYQASLFALGSIMCFLGVTVERHDNDFVLIDVWTAHSINGKQHRRPEEIYQFLRFKTLDHFHKWAILKRLLRTLEIECSLVTLLKEAIEGLGDKEFAKHRNLVNYQSGGWIADDLLSASPQGPVTPPGSFQELFTEIYEGTSTGTVYLMCALIELASKFLEEVSQNAGPLTQEQALLGRRSNAVQIITGLNWASISQ